MRFSLVKTKCLDLYTTMTSQPSSEKRHNCRLGGFNDPKVVVGGRGAYALAACAPLVIHKSLPKRNVINHLPTTDRASLMAPLPNLSATSHAFMRPLKNAIANRNKYKEEEDEQQEQQQQQQQHQHQQQQKQQKQSARGLWGSAQLPQRNQVDSEALSHSDTDPRHTGTDTQVIKTKINPRRHSNVIARIPTNLKVENNFKTLLHTRQANASIRQASASVRRAVAHNRPSKGIDIPLIADDHPTIKDDTPLVGNNKGFFIQVEHSMN